MSINPAHIDVTRTALWAITRSGLNPHNDPAPMWFISEDEARRALTYLNEPEATLWVCTILSTTSTSHWTQA